ncbi:MAG: ketosteroid isomerase-like protein [Woeseiaceae bacterium]|jgi:ketosteroid isomerase-like protein
MRTANCISSFFVALGLGLLAILPGCSYEATDRVEQTRDIVALSLMSWETLDENEFSSTAHDDLVFAYPGERTDLEGALKVFRMWKAKFKDTRVYIHQILVDGNQFAAEYQFATTNIASGKRTVMGTTAVGEVRDGAIILLKEYTDGQVDDMQRDGKLPLDEGDEPYPWPDISSE